MLLSKRACPKPQQSRRSKANTKDHSITVRATFARLQPAMALSCGRTRRASCRRVILWAGGAACALGVPANVAAAPTHACHASQVHVSPGTPPASAMWVSWATLGNCTSVVEWAPVVTGTRRRAEATVTAGSSGASTGSTISGGKASNGVMSVSCMDFRAECPTVAPGKCNKGWVKAGCPMSCGQCVGGEPPPPQQPPQEQQQERWRQSQQSQLQSPPQSPPETQAPLLGGQQSRGAGGFKYRHGTSESAFFQHHVLLQGLTAGSRYDYRVGGSLLRPSGGDARALAEDEAAAAVAGAEPQHFSEAWAFSTQAAGGDGRAPLRLSVVGDLGQSRDAVRTFAAIHASLDDEAPPPRTSLLAVVGDLSYAEGDGSRWDAWLALHEPVLATLPMVAVVGNHEVELDRQTGLAFGHFRERFRMPEVAPEVVGRSVVRDYRSYDYSLKFDFGGSFYSFDAGLAHCVMLNTYAPSGPGSAQRAWLAADLAAVDRSRTPWVLAFTHGPWYNTNFKHQAGKEKATDAMKASLEPLFHEHKVGCAFAGHVHAYERSHPVYKGRRTDTGDGGGGGGGGGGTVYVTVGGGGQKLEGTWLNETSVGSGVAGASAAVATPKPAWAAFRSGSRHGRGDAIVVNATHLLWRWWDNPLPSEEEKAGGGGDTLADLGAFLRRSSTGGGRVGVGGWGGGGPGEAGREAEDEAWIANPFTAAPDEASDARPPGPSGDAGRAAGLAPGRRPGLSSPLSLGAKSLTS